MGIMRELRNRLPLLVAGLLALGLSIGFGVLATVGTNSAAAGTTNRTFFVNNDAGLQTIDEDDSENGENDAGDSEDGDAEVEATTCDNPDYDAIQPAINASSNGDTVKVCTGDDPYDGSVQVNKSITLTAADTLELDDCSSTDDDAPVVDPPNPQTDGFDLLTDNITLSGFVITGGDNAPGVATSASHSGYKIQNNRIEKNTYGMYYNADDGRTSTVDGNCFTDNNEPGGATGDGILSETGLRNAKIEDNEFSEHDANPIALASPDQKDITVAKNSISDNQASAVFVDGGDNVDFDENDITGSGGNGLNLFGVTGSDITKTTIGGDVNDGIRLSRKAGAGSQGSTGNTVSGSEMDATGRDGIRVDDDESSNNTITGNDARLTNDIGGVDCRDQSMGDGTANTENTWTNDIGDESSPPGLCFPEDTGTPGGGGSGGGDDDNGSRNRGGHGGGGGGGNNNNDNDNNDPGVLPPLGGILGTANTCGLFRQNFGGPAKVGRLALCVAATNRVIGSVAPLVVTPTQACSGTRLSKKRRRGQKRSDYGACVRSIQLTLTGLGRVL